MSAILTKIKVDSLAARKAKSVVSGVLTTLLGEIATKEKTFNPARAVTDDEVTAIVKKFIKNTDETIAALAARMSDDNRPKIALAQAEKDALSLYLPQQLSEADLEAVIEGLIGRGDRAMGAIMAALKTEYAGRYDGKLASSVVKRILG